LQQSKRPRTTRSSTIRQWLIKKQLADWPARDKSKPIGMPQPRKKDKELQKHRESHENREKRKSAKSARPTKKQDATKKKPIE
jgi:hypothetical protein